MRSAIAKVVHPCGNPPCGGGIRLVLHIKTYNCSANIFATAVDSLFLHNVLYVITGAWAFNDHVTLTSILIFVWSTVTTRMHLLLLLSFQCYLWTSMCLISILVIFATILLKFEVASRSGLFDQSEWDYRFVHCFSPLLIRGFIVKQVFIRMLQQQCFHNVSLPYCFRCHCL